MPALVNFGRSKTALPLTTLALNDLPVPLITSLTLPVTSIPSGAVTLTTALVPSPLVIVLSTLSFTFGSALVTCTAMVLVEPRCVALPE